MTKHSKFFSPSAADRWLSCLASPKFIDSLNLPDKTSEAMETGTAAHALLEKSLKTNKHPTTYKGEKFNGIEADAEMVAAVGLCYDWTMAKVLAGYELKTERSLQIAVTGDTGTTDITLYHPATLHLIVADYKNGKGYAVNPVKNRQMRLYACGTMDADKLWGKLKRLTLVVWQPHVSEQAQEWEDSPAGIEHFRRKVGQIVDKIRAGGCEFTPGESQCRWCPAKAQCKTYWQHMAAAVKLEFGQIIAANGVSLPSCDALTTEELINIWNNIDAVTALCKAVNECLFCLAKQGKPTPGVKLVEGRSNRQWTSEDEAKNTLRKLGLSMDEIAPRALLGIAAIEKLVPKDKREMLQAVISKPRGKPTLAVESDPRPPISTADFPPLEPEL